MQEMGTCKGMGMHSTDHLKERQIDGEALLDEWCFVEKKKKALVEKCTEKRVH